jgi:hypothetical protein
MRLNVEECGRTVNQIVEYYSRNLAAALAWRGCASASGGPRDKSCHHQQASEQIEAERPRLIRRNNSAHEEWTQLVSHSNDISRLSVVGSA